MAIAAGIGGDVGVVDGDARVIEPAVAVSVLPVPMIDLGAALDEVDRTGGRAGQREARRAASCWSRALVGRRRRRRRRSDRS